MSEPAHYSRDGIAKTARDMRNDAQRRGVKMNQEQAERRVREAIRKSPIKRK